MTYRAEEGPSQYVVTAFSGWVVCLEAATGKELWRVQMPGGASLTVRLHLEGDELLALSGGELRRLRIADGETLARIALTDGHRTLLVDGRRAFVSARGELSCVDLDRGKVLWRNELEGTGYGPAAIAVPGRGVVQGDADT